MPPIRDPRKYIKDILTPIAVTKDDNITPAKVLVVYESGPENMRHLFYVDNYDAVITVVRHRERESGEGKRLHDVPIRYNGEIPLHVISMDDTGVTATKLLNKIRLAIIAMVEGAAQGLFPWDVNATIGVQYDGKANQITGGFDPLWMDEYLVRIRPIISVGGGILIPVPPVGPPPVVVYYGFEEMTPLLKFEDGFERV